MIAARGDDWDLVNLAVDEEEEHEDEADNEEGDVGKGMPPDIDSDDGITGAHLGPSDDTDTVSVSLWGVFSPTALVASFIVTKPNNSDTCSEKPHETSMLTNTNGNSDTKVSCNSDSG